MSRVIVTAPPLIPGLRTVPAEGLDWQELDACTLCGSRDSWIDVAQTRSHEALCIFAACRACESVFMRRRPSPSWWRDFYRFDWDDAGRSSASVGRGTDPRALRFCEGHLDGARTVLDLGAGFGASLLAFDRAGLETHALEASEHRAARLEELGIACHRGRLEDWTPAERFDVVTLIHVLEHLPSPGEALDRIAGLLEESGLLYVAVPELWQEAPAQAVHFLPHLSWFTQQGLKRELVDRGFEILDEEVSYDLRILARLDRSERPRRRDDAAVDEPSFVARLEGWLADGFGLGSGRVRKTWARDPSHRRWWRTRTWRGALGEVRWHLLGAARHLPQRLARRLLPVDLRAHKLRSLAVEASEAVSLPVVIEHPHPSTALWVK